MGLSYTSMVSTSNRLSYASSVSENLNMLNLRNSTLIKMMIGALQNMKRIIKLNTPSCVLFGPFLQVTPFHNLTVSQHQTTLPTHANVISGTVSIDKELILMPLCLCEVMFLVFFPKTFKGINQCQFSECSFSVGN